MGGVARGSHEARAELEEEELRGMGLQRWECTALCPLCFDCVFLPL